MTYTLNVKHNIRQDNLHQESPFERYISKKIAEQNAESQGWVVSPNDEGFDATLALYMQKFSPSWENNLSLALVKALENDGSVKVLREGFKMAGFSTISCSEHYPDFAVWGGKLLPSLKWKIQPHFAVSPYNIGNL